MRKGVDLNKLSPEQFAQGLKVLKRQIRTLKKQQMREWLDYLKDAFKGNFDDASWQKLNAEYETKIIKRKKAIDAMMQKATVAQNNYLERNRNRKFMYLGMGGIGAVIVIANIVSGINRSVEEGRNYYINIDEEIVLECGAVFDEKSEAVRCPEQQIAGEYSDYESVELKNNGIVVGKVGTGWSDSVTYAVAEIGGEIEVADGKFTKQVAAIEIPKEKYQTEDYNKEEIAREYGAGTSENFILYNKILQKEVVSKTVRVRWQFAEADLALLDQKNTEWQTAEAERKAAEAAEKAAEASRQAELQQRDSGVSNGSSSSSSRSTSPNSGVKDVVSGYCNDGTYVTGNPSARGAANACYGHKGWRDY